MEHSHIESRERNSMLTWVLLAFGLLTLIVLIVKGCGHNGSSSEFGVNTHKAAISSSSLPTSENSDHGWNTINFNAPAASYEEITDTSINVRGSDKYGIYGLGENILFDEGKATIRNTAEANLEEIAGSIEKRYHGGNVRVYGFTDASGSAGSNKELAEQRAEAVRAWLLKNGNIAENRLSIHPVGEAQPVATNATSEGRRLNRRVEIVALSAETGH